MAKTLAVSTERFTRLAKRISKVSPGSAAAKQLRPLMELELVKIMQVGGKRAAEKAIRNVKIGAHKLELAEKKGSLSKWRTRIGLGMQVLEVALLFTAAMKGVSVRLGAQRTARSAARRGRRAPARKRARRK